MNSRQIVTLVVGIVLMLACIFLTPNEHRWFGPLYLPARSYDLSTLFVLWLTLAIVTTGMIWTFSTGTRGPTKAQSWIVWISAVVILLTILFPAQSYLPFGYDFKWVFTNEPIDGFHYMDYRTEFLLMHLGVKLVPVGILILGFWSLLNRLQRLICLFGCFLFLLVSFNVDFLIIKYVGYSDEWTWEHTYGEKMPYMMPLWAWIIGMIALALLITGLVRLKRNSMGNT